MARCHQVDIEITNIPGAGNHQRWVFRLLAIVVFSAVFFLSFVYEVAKGGLDWGPLQRMRRLTEGVSAERTLATTIRRVGLDGRPDEDEAA